jgi:hypothetical protein
LRFCFLQGWDILLFLFLLMPSGLKRLYGQCDLHFVTFCCYTSPALSRFGPRRFYDFNVWTRKKMKEKLHCTHANPVNERLVKRPQDWPWSSFSFYATGERGLICIDVVD